MTERTLVLIKPDAVARNLTGQILARYEAKGLRIVGLQLRTIDGAFADRHYAEHVGKDFYPPVREFITSGPLVAVALEGENAVACVRVLNGATKGFEAVPGSIRGDFCTSMRENAVHGSDSPESAQRELALWFPELAR